MKKLFTLLTMMLAFTASSFAEGKTVYLSAGPWADDGGHFAVWAWEGENEGQWIPHREQPTSCSPGSTPQQPWVATPGRRARRTTGPLTSLLILMSRTAWTSTGSPPWVPCTGPRATSRACSRSLGHSLRRSGNGRTIPSPSRPTRAGRTYTHSYGTTTTGPTSTTGSSRSRTGRSPSPRATERRSQPPSRTASTPIPSRPRTPLQQRKERHCQGADRQHGVRQRKTV